MKALIIGYGSIGRRHDEVLKKMRIFEEINLVSGQKIDNRLVFNSLDKVIDINSYDYFLIASATNKHYDQLTYIDKIVLDKKIFCEKPLFDKAEKYSPKNRVFVGYVMRYHPLFKVLSGLLKDDNPIYVHVQVGSYLPSWRNNIDYRESYSAHKERGGGVLLDLSHEIDYITWLFGMIKEVKSIQTKISNLEINSDDITTFIGKTVRGAVVNVSMDYISKFVFREMKIHTDDSTIDVDFIDNCIVKYSKDGTIYKPTIPSVERNDLLSKMHMDILKDAETACSYYEGNKIMDVITMIQEQNCDI